MIPLVVCKRCGRDVTPTCVGGKSVVLDADPHGDGEYTIFAGHHARIVDDWQRVHPRDGTVKRRNVNGLRYKAHACTESLKPETDLAKTRDIRPKRRPVR